MIYEWNGEWTVRFKDNTYKIQLPNTLDRAGIGEKDTGANQWHPDEALKNEEFKTTANDPITTRFTRKVTYEGAVQFIRKINVCVPSGQRAFLEIERAKCLSLFIDNQEIPHAVEPSISTPHIFEVTDFLKGEHEICLVSDNSLPGLPHDAIVYSSAATDETQTNWNGLLGYIRLRIEPQVYLSSLRVYPKGKTLTVTAEISSTLDWKGTITLKSDFFEIQRDIEMEKGVHIFTWIDIPLDKKEIKLWDEGEGNLYQLTATLSHGAARTVSFGVRDWRDNGKGRFTLNGRVIFIRSDANCAEFPETGHPPMTVEEWTDILLRYRAYGVNCMRFHSNCPPEAAFEAADNIGMLMQPELSHWNPRDAFESEESFLYYQAELRQILYCLANHPSFIMLTFGNELAASQLGHQRMKQLLRLAKSIDSTRLYAIASNAHYGGLGCDEESDFYTSQKYKEKDIRGTFANMEGYINHSYPNGKTNYDEAMRSLRESFRKPVFTFEVGQYEILPDFDELEEFKGISDPANYRVIQKKVVEKGLLPKWKRYVEATGELSRIGYREEVEAVLRTQELSGISLLGLQDFPGQGTALVGMMNAHLQPKPFPFASPEKFQQFFRDTLPLVLLEKYTYENTETLIAKVVLANYGKHAVQGVPTYKLEVMESQIDRKVNGKANTFPLTFGVLTQEGEEKEVYCPQGQLSEIGTCSIPLSMIDKPTRLNLWVMIGEAKNSYPIWVYPPVTPVCPSMVYETTCFDENARAVLEQGGIVYLSPDSTREALPNSIQAQFTTDFWSVGTFAGQEGGMGQLIDSRHPLFAEFPTEFHTNWQWWPMAVQRAVILPKNYQAIITELDSCAYLRPMAQLIEFRCLKGKVLFSSMGLQNLQQYIECRALLHSMYRYLVSTDMNPKQEITPEELTSLLAPTNS